MKKNKLVTENISEKNRGKVVLAGKVVSAIGTAVTAIGGFLKHYVPKKKK